MKTKLMAAAVAVLIPVSALQAMTVAVFLQKADALRAMGVRAMASRDLPLLKTEVTTAAASLRAEREAAQRAGRRAAFCPPPQGRAGINSEELVAYFRGLPPAQRQRTQVRDAMRGFMIRRYPCR